MEESIAQHASEFFDESTLREIEALVPNDTVSLPIVKQFQDVAPKQAHRGKGKFAHFATKRAYPKKTFPESTLEGTLRKTDQLELYRSFTVNIEARANGLKRTVDKLNQDLTFLLHELHTFKKMDLSEESELSDQNSTTDDNDEENNGSTH